MLCTQYTHTRFASTNEDEHHLFVLIFALCSCVCVCAHQLSLVEMHHNHHHHHHPPSTPAQVVKYKKLLHNDILYRCIQSQCTPGLDLNTAFA